MKLKLYLVSFFMILWGLTTNSSPQPSEKFDSLINRAEKAFQQGHIDSSINMLKEMEKRFSQNGNRKGLLKNRLKLLDLTHRSPIHDNYKPIITSVKTLATNWNKDVLRAKLLVFEAEANVNAHQFQKASNQLQKALKIYGESKETEAIDLVHLYSNLIRVNMKLWNNQEVNKYFEEANNLLGDTSYKNKKIIQELYSNYAAAQFQLGNFAKAKHYFEKSGKALKEQYSEGHPLYLDFHLALAKVFLRASEVDSVIKHIDKGMNLIDLHDLEKSEYAGNLYFVKAQAYEIPENHTKSLRILKKAQDIFRKTLPPEDNRLFQIKLALVRCYNNIGELDKGLEIAEEALRFIDNQPDLMMKRVNFNKARIHQHLAKMQRKKGNLKEAKNAVNKALQYYKIILPPGHLNLASAYSEYFQIAIKQGDLDTALKVLNKIKPILENSLPPRSPELVDYGYAKFARVYTSQKQYEKALNKSQKGFELITTHFKPSNHLVNPDLDQIVEPEVGYYLGFEKLVALYGMAKQKRGDPSFLQKAYETALLTDSIVNKIRADFLLRDEHNTWLKKNNQFYPLSIRAFNDLLKSPEIGPSFKNQIKKNAFLFADKDKASMLSAAHAEREILNSGKVPDSLLHPIRRVNKQIDQISQKLKKIEDSAKRLNFQNKRLVKFKKKHQLYQKLCNEYTGKCRQLKGLEVTDLGKLQKNLGDHNKNLVEYIGYDSIWFAITITPDKVHVTQLDGTQNIIGLIQRFREKITERHFSAGTKTGHQLYQKLVAPIEDQLTSENLVIVPDGIIGYLPFSALMNKRARSGNIDHSNFLLNQYVITYSPSASLWNYSKKNGGNKMERSKLRAFMGFAPTFDSDLTKENTLADREEKDTLRGALGNIPHAKQEVKDILQFYPGKIQLGDKATEKQFKKLVPKFSIIHLATHGLLDDENPAYNKLIFARDSGSSEDGNLHTYELYNLDLNADLAVLSACNTGYGSIKQGEGVLNMARGFKVAGCPNILMTLWSIDDRSSSDLMNLFYKNLNQGKSKSKALQEAKLTYLKQNDQNVTNPFYWAGFVMMGSNQEVAVKEGDDTPTYWIVSGAFILLLVGWVFWRYQKSNAA